MKRIVPAIVVASVGLGLAAQSTGTVKGQVVDTKGSPIPGSVVVFSRIGITWVKELKTNKEGKFFQVGFSAGDYEIKISAPGFVTLKEQEHIGLSVIEKNFILLTPSEAAKSGASASNVDPSQAAEAQGLDSFNQAVSLYNSKDFIAALPLFESAVDNLKESINKSTEATVKSELETKLTTVSRPFAFTLVEVGKTDEIKRIELYTKAEPVLTKLLEVNPKDQSAIACLLEIATAKKDAEGIKKYQAALDALLGPRPELAYNQGVELYNAGKLAEAKPFFLKSLGVKADFADAYYLLAMCEFSENNLKGTKANLQKYIELAPTGKHAAEVKAMLADPSLKNIK